ncbi:MAG TPA: hypothetical protein VK826_20170 [Bacteroidia bacterium]|nr:hypothetical protein [Bacteroidia bacterium]
MKRMLAFLLLILPGMILPVVAGTHRNEHSIPDRISSVSGSSSRTDQLADPQDEINLFATPSTDHQFRTPEKSNTKFRGLKRGCSLDAFTGHFRCAPVKQSKSPDSGQDLRLRLFCIMRC